MSEIKKNSNDENATSDASLSSDLIRKLLPACQPQEGSPANTFTHSEIQELAAALPNLNIKEAPSAPTTFDICQPWTTPEQEIAQEERECLDWHGAPNFDEEKIRVTREFRQSCRNGSFTGPTNGQCPGFLQCNLVVLPQGKPAFDFLLFCQRNPKACPLIEVCDVGSYCPSGVAPGADLRKDCPKYAIYRDGKLEKEVIDVTDYWPEDSVAFLIGCSFSYDGALLNASIPLRSAEQGKNVPMYKTNLKCRPAGSLQGNVVVSMKPIPALDVAKEVEITSKYTHAHGAPVCIGRPDCIGIADINKPDWGDTVQMRHDEVAVFHACGVTPQAVLMESKIPFAITHSAGHMFITDLPSDMGVL